MWFFGKKDKDSKDKGKKDVAAPAAAKVATSKDQKAAALLAQMRTLRAEIGEENLQEIVKKLKLDELKKKVRSDIENDPRARDRLLDEIRFQVHDADRKPPTRH